MSLSPLFVSRRYKDAIEKAEELEQALHNLLGCIDMTEESEVEKAHGILNMVAQVQKMQSAIQKANPYAEEQF